MKQLLIILLILFVNCVAAASNCGIFFHMLQFMRSQRVETIGRPEGDSWGLSDGVHNLYSPMHYDNYFRSILPESSFQQLCQQRREAGLSNHILELFGSGVFIDPAAVDTLTGVRLAATQFDDAPKDPSGKRQQVEGDIFSRQTSQSVLANMQSRGIPSFDIFVIRPVGGVLRSSGDQFAATLGYAKALLTGLNRYYPMLSRNGGTMFIEIKEELVASGVYDYWTHILQLQGFQVQTGPSATGGTVMRLTRTTNCPNVIPGW